MMGGLTEDSIIDTGKSIDFLNLVSEHGLLHYWNLCRFRTKIM